MGTVPFFPMPRDVTQLLIPLAVAACVVVWAWVVGRWFHRRALPFQPRRPVPWRGIDVLLVAMAYVFVPALLMHASRGVTDVATVDKNVSTVAKSEPVVKAPLDKRHDVQRILSAEGPSLWTAVLVAVTAMVIAPITEELVFRLLSQGWLESVERRMRRQMPWMRRIVPGLLPVAIVAELFAYVHIRMPGQDVSTVIVQLQWFAVASLIVVAVLVCWLKYAAGATLADFGIVPSKLAGDIRLGLLTFLAVTPPIYGIFFVANTLLPKDSVADPIPMLFFGLVLGVLYFRTHRIVPSIVTHAAFNTVGVFVALTAS
jgi:membrane protease YdiL (CAAX protease family)